MSSIIYAPKSSVGVGSSVSTGISEPTLYLFIINARHLSIRRDKVKTIVKQIADIYKYRVIPKFITTNDPVDLEPQLANMKDRIGYDQCGDQDFDKLLEVLNIETLSNLFKHMDVWSQITNGVYNPNDLFLVIEDDTVIMNDNIQQFRDLFDYLINNNNNNNSQWDILFPGLAQPNNTTSKEIELTTVSSIFKIIPSKESYFINKQTAHTLMKVFNETKISYSFRIAISKYLFTTTKNAININSIKAMIPNRRCTIDGSKLGFFPTTIHNNNLLLYNGEYMELFTIFTLPVDEIKRQFQRAKQIYNSTKHINSPDITQIFGVILMKLEKYDEAEDILKLAIDQTKQAQGILNNRCDICNNIVNLYEKLQTDISHISKNPSKYSNYDSIPLKD